jgi:hypothetical protein
MENWVDIAPVRQSSREFERPRTRQITTIPRSSLLLVPKKFIEQRDANKAERDLSKDSLNLIDVLGF